MNEAPDRTESVFAAAVPLENPGERAALLDRECGDDQALRGRVEALLQAHEKAGHLLDQPAPGRLDQTGAYISSELPGTVIAGRYKLLEAIGEGGMGTVWVAEQSQPVRRKVALKLIKAGMDSKSVLARFEAERQALAVMDHPNIAKVLDGGITETGRPFFVMEYVKGVSITDYCDATRLSVPERLNLFVQVCQAVQHAHQKGIIHRDLKPSNILVAPYDDRPVPKVIDFGLAKAMYQSLTEKTLHTAHETVLGTPLYMSPEQAQLNNLDVDTRSDIYSLGVLLYELLTGTTPLEKKRCKEAAWEEVRRLIREEEPPRPSTRLSSTDTLASLAAGRQIEPARLTRLVRGELDWIVMKSLEKDRTRRYETANGFASDILRYLAGEPVLAAPPSARYRLKKFVHRNRPQVVAATLILLVLLGGIAGTTIGLIEARRQKANAVDEAAAKEEARQAEAEQRGIAEAAAIAEREAKLREQARADGEVKERKRADVEKERAVRFLDRALDTLRATTGEDVEKLIGSKKELTVNEREYLEAIAKRWQDFARQIGTDTEARSCQAEGHNRVGFLWLMLGRREEARAELILGRDLTKKLAEELPTNATILLELDRCHTNLGSVLQDLGKLQEARTEYESAIRVGKSLVDRFTAEPKFLHSLVKSQTALAGLLAQLDLLEEALTEARSARDATKKLLMHFPAERAYQASLADTQDNLGIMLSDLGRREDARGEFRSACDLYAKLVERFPTNLDYEEGLSIARAHLGSQLALLGKFEEAQAELRSSRRLCIKLVELYPAVPAYQENLARTQLIFGSVFGMLGNKEEARIELQASCDLRMKLVEQCPAVANYRKNLADSRLNLADQLAKLGKPKEALAEFCAARELRKKLVEQFPDVLNYRFGLGFDHFNVAIVLGDLGRFEEARTEYLSALEVQKKLVVQFPTRSDYLHNLASTHGALASLFSENQKWSDSRAHQLIAIDQRTKLAKQFPANTGYQIALGGSYCDYGFLYLRERNWLEAFLWFSRAVGVLEPIRKGDAQNAQVKELLDNHVNRGRWESLGHLQKEVEWLQEWDRVMKLCSPDEKIGLRVIRAWVRCQAGMVVEAIPDISELTNSEKLSADQWYDCACVYAVASGKFVQKTADYSDRAMILLRKAVSCGWKDPDLIKKDTDLDPIRHREDFKKLLEDLERTGSKEQLGPAPREVK